MNPARLVMLNSVSAFHDTCPSPYRMLIPVMLGVASGPMPVSGMWVEAPNRPCENCQPPAQNRLSVISTRSEARRLSTIVVGWVTELGFAMYVGHSLKI